MTQQQALTILKSGRNVFLTGEPGAGKTYTINQFIKWARGEEKLVAATSFSGIAATHINGQTLQSWAGIGIKKELSENQIATIMENERTLTRLKEVDILIIDEISMLDGKILNIVDTVLRVANGTEEGTFDDAPFGGKQVIFVGDFYQLPPIYDKYRDKTFPIFSFQASSWEVAEPIYCYLTEQHRQADMGFVEILRAIRDQTLLDKPALRNLLKTRLLLPPEGEEITHLETHNDKVNSYNEEKLAALEGKEYKTIMIETCVHPNLKWMLDALKDSCLSPWDLRLKVGALVMFTRNNQETGYVNGTLGTIVDFKSGGEPVVETKDGKEITAQKATWHWEDDRGFPKASITQYPLKLAWAMTIHKSQGVSLDAAVIDLTNPFAEGQGYVALSRVRSLSGLYLTGLSKKAAVVNAKVVEQDKIFRAKSEEALKDIDQYETL